MNCGRDLGVRPEFEPCSVTRKLCSLESDSAFPNFSLCLSMLGSKVTEVPFGSISLWFVLLLVPANAALGSPAGFVLAFSTPSD